LRGIDAGAKTYGTQHKDELVARRTATDGSVTGVIRYNQSSRVRLFLSSVSTAMFLAMRSISLHLVATASDSAAEFGAIRTGTHLDRCSQPRRVFRRTSVLAQPTIVEAARVRVHLLRQRDAERVIRERSEGTGSRDPFQKYGEFHNSIFFAKAPARDPSAEAARLPPFVKPPIETHGRDYPNKKSNDCEGN
jgi:hypothetical protein